MLYGTFVSKASIRGWGGGAWQAVFSGTDEAIRALALKQPWNRSGIIQPLDWLKDERTMRGEKTFVTDGGHASKCKQGFFFCHRRVSLSCFGSYQINKMFRWPQDKPAKQPQKQTLNLIRGLGLFHFEAFTSNYTADGKLVILNSQISDQPEASWIGLVVGICT